MGDAFDCPDSGPAGDQLPHPAETGSETPRCYPSPGDGRPYLCHLLFPERLSFPARRAGSGTPGTASVPLPHREAYGHLTQGTPSGRGILVTGCGTLKRVPVSSDWRSDDLY